MCTCFYIDVQLFVSPQAFMLTFQGQALISHIIKPVFYHSDPAPVSSQDDSAGIVYVVDIFFISNFVAGAVG